MPTPDSRNSSRARKYGLTTLRVAIAVALLYYLVSSEALKWSALLELVRQWRSTGAALVLLAIALALTAWRLCVLLRPAGFHLSLVSSVRLTLIGTFFNTCMLGSGGGDVVRIYYATVGNVGRRTEVVTVMLLDRVAGLFALMLWPLLVILPLRTPLTNNPVVAGLLATAAAIALAIATLLTVALWGNFKDSRMVKATLGFLPGGGYLRRALETIHSYKAGRAALAKAVGISLIAHTMAMLATLLLASAVVNATGYGSKLVVVLPLGFLANAIPLTPGGLGVGEAAFESLFKIVGVGGGAEVMLAWRILMVFLGLSGLLLYLQGGRRLVFSAYETASDVMVTKSGPEVTRPLAGSRR